jgi:tetraacyldisaccharide 4'-kinase
VISLRALWRPEGVRGLVPRLLWCALLPGEAVFRAAVRLRSSAYNRGWRNISSPPIAVISVGGLEVGGVGKTPLVRELVRIAAGRGLRPAVVTRGFGGSASRGRTAPQRVPQPAPPEAPTEYGDEPVWLAEETASWDTTGVWIAPRRIQGVQAAARVGAGLIILDDGLQHRALRRDGEIVSLAGGAPWGNKHLLPAGPLREEPTAALARAHCVILSEVDPAGAAATEARIRPMLPSDVFLFSWQGKPALRAVRGIEPEAGEEIHLLAAIAHPERLLPSLSRLGHPVVSTRFLPDHHRFSRAELASVLRQVARGRSTRGAAAAAAEGEGPCLVTTEKDWMRLRALLPAEARARGAPNPNIRLSVLIQTLCWNEPEAEPKLGDWLERIVRSFRSGEQKPLPARRPEERGDA